MSRLVVCSFKVSASWLRGQEHSSRSVQGQFLRLGVCEELKITVGCEGMILDLAIKGYSLPSNSSFFKKQNVRILST